MMGGLFGGGAGSSNDDQSGAKTPFKSAPRRQDADSFTDWVEDLEHWVEGMQDSKYTDRQIALSISQGLSNDDKRLIRKSLSKEERRECAKIISKLTEEFEKDDVDKGYSTWHRIKRALRKRGSILDASLSRWEVLKEDFIKHSLGGVVLPENFLAYLLPD